MDLIPEFIERKHGKQRVDYLDPRLEPILAPTYGIMVYQEQVMQIAQVIGGYTLGGADLLRRAMGKKKPEEMAQQRDIFVAGAREERPDRATRPTQLFDLMEKFAGYGFNKSHAAAYALVAYQTAYMKAHHPAAFMAANLSAVMDDTDKVHQFYEDAVANGLKVLPPDINAPSTASCRSTTSSPLRPGRDQGHRRVGDRGDPRGARGRAARSAICSTSAAAWTSASSTAACSRRWSAPAPSTASTITAHSLLASAGIAIEAAEQASRAAAQISLFGGESAHDGGRPRAGRAPALDARGSACSRKSRRSASTSAGICSPATRTSWRRSPRTRLAKPYSRRTRA